MRDAALGAAMTREKAMMARRKSLIAVPSGRSGCEPACGEADAADAHARFRRYTRRFVAAAIAAGMSAGPASVLAQSTETYEYDALGRLVGVGNAGTEDEINYAYDGAGNRITVTTSLDVRFSVDDVSVSEGGNLVFTVTKAGPTTGSHAVSYATANNTATAGSDYTAKSGSLTFLAADATKTVTVVTIEDTAVESDETLYLNLSAPTGGATITDSQGVGTIENDDITNSPPVAVNDSPSFPFGSSISIPVTNNDSDPDAGTGDTFSVTSVTTPTQGTAVIETGGQSVLFTKPAGSNCGNAIFNYTITDSYSATDTATVSVDWGQNCF